MRLAPLLAVLFMSCEPSSQSHLQDAARSAGLLDAHAQPLDLLVLCDPSEFSTCDADSLRETLDRLVLPVAASRPGSRVRLYVLGSDIPARLVASQESTSASRPIPKLVAKHETQWRASALDFFMTAARPSFDSNALRSRIAEALTRIAAADPVSDAQRMIIYIGDMRETGVAMFETCHALPQPEAFLASLDAADLLRPSSMTGTVVLFTFTSINNARSVQCDTPARSAAVKALWRAAITRAGGAPTFFDTYPSTLERKD